MLYEVISEIALELNTHFKLRFGLPEDKLFVSNIVNNDGSEAIEKDSIIFSVVNIEEEKLLGNRKNISDNVPVSLKIIVLFTSTFTGDRYPEGLKFIAEIVGYFQQNRYMEIEGNRLNIEIFNININDQNSLWASLGAKYNASIAYQIGLIKIDESMTPEPYVPAQNFPGN